MFYKTAGFRTGNPLVVRSYRTTLHPLNVVNSCVTVGHLDFGLGVIGQYSLTVKSYRTTVLFECCQQLCNRGAAGLDTGKQFVITTAETT